MQHSNTLIRHWLFAVTCAALWALLPAAPARADVSDAPGSQLSVALITYGPGTIYWERFGHDAIEVTDTVSGDSLTFNYGVFDFAQRNFLLNFARGRMRYSIGAVPTDEDIAWFADQGRSVTRQALALTPAQRAELRDYLLWNLRPQNAQYDYDYYISNCATRVRDVLDRALGGQLHAQWQTSATRPSYRWQTDRLLAGQPWLMLVVDLGLGPYADHPLSVWQESFLPMALSRAAAKVQIDDGSGHQQPLVTRRTVLAPSRLSAPPAQPPNLLWPLGLAGGALALLLGWGGWNPQRRVRRFGFAVGASAFALLGGLIGLVLVILWACTAHHAAWGNQNLLLFDPLALLLVPGLWRLRRASAISGRFLTTLASVAGVLALFALVGKALGLPYQHNLAWIAFALPLWFALLLGIYRRRTV